MRLESGEWREDLLVKAHLLQEMLSICNFSPFDMTPHCQEAIHIKYWKYLWDPAGLLDKLRHKMNHLCQ